MQGLAGALNLLNPQHDTTTYCSGSIMLDAVAVGILVPQDTHTASGTCQPGSAAARCSAVTSPGHDLTPESIPVPECDPRSQLRRVTGSGGVQGEVVALPE